MPGRSRRTPRAEPKLIRISAQRRRLCQWMLIPAAQLLVPAAWADATRIGSARVWPAEEYTRVIVESNAPLAHQLHVLRDPHPLVLDLDGIDATSELAKLPSRVHASDPYIAAIRVGRQSPTALRVVLDLKAEVKPDVFALQPVAAFGHRLGRELYPLIPLDPLMALLESERLKERTAPPDPATLPQARAQTAQPDRQGAARPHT